MTSESELAIGWKGIDDNIISDRENEGVIMINKMRWGDAGGKEWFDMGKGLIGIEIDDVAFHQMYDKFY